MIVIWHIILSNKCVKLFFCIIYYVMEYSFDIFDKNPDAW